MTLVSILALAGAMFLLAATPGPGVFATVARSLASGFGHATVVVAGIVTGDLVFLLLAIYGLASFAELLGDFFLFICQPIFHIVGQFIDLSKRFFILFSRDSKANIKLRFCRSTLYNHINNNI